MSKDQEDVLIRDFKKPDLDDLLDVANKSFSKEFEVSGFDPDHIRKMTNRMFSFWGRIFLGLLKLMGKEPFKLFVAEADGKLVGTTMVNTRDKTGYIAAVMVHPSYRTKGIATKLMKSALKYTQEKRLNRAVLHVVPTNIPAKGLYHKLGFERFENVVDLVANIDSLQKPQNVKNVQVRDFEKKDRETVYDLIKRSEDPKHLKVWDFKKKDLDTSLVKRIIRLATEKKIVAAKNDLIVGYAEVIYTTAEEAGRIRNIQVHPDMPPKGIEEMLIFAGVNHIKNVGTNKIIATTLSTKQELVEKMKQLGFKRGLEMEGMVLEFRD